MTESFLTEHHNFMSACTSFVCFTVNSFVPYLITYYGVCSTVGPQHFMCHASVTGVDLFIYKIEFYTANSEGCVVNSFDPYSIHIGLQNTISTNIFISGNIFYG
jgi:hypothetical protein